MNTMNFKTFVFFLTLTIISFTNSVTINQNSLVEESYKKCGKVGGVSRIINRKVVDGWARYYSIDNVNRIQKKTLISKWTIYAKSTKPVQLLIYRKSGTKFTVVGKSSLKNPRMGANTFNLKKPIKANKGDYIGWYVPKGGVIAFTLNQRGRWLIRNLRSSTLFTSQGKSATALQYSSPRTYSINVSGCEPRPTPRPSPRPSPRPIAPVIHRNITEGMTVRITHYTTKKHLHSHKINYKVGSHQQEVTGYGGKDSNDLWEILHTWSPQDTFTEGSELTLTHKNTRKKLHSHNIQSPVTHQQEVSAYGKGDSNDNWILHLPKHAKGFVNGMQFRLEHKNTKKYLHSHKKNLQSGSKQQEVTAYSKRDSNDYWIISIV